VTRRLSSPTSLSSHPDWGGWRLNTSNYTLEHPDGPARYYVDLERCLTSAEVLDFIAQIAGKTWADDACLAGLVRALKSVLRVQSLLCSSGLSKELTAEQVRELVAKAGT
jgi:hypothetical protein